MAIKGYFQYIPAIRDILPKICDDMNEYLRYRKELLREKYGLRELYTLGCIHVRRGDYLRAPEHHRVQPVSYYEAAINHPSLRHVRRWLVISDDVTWCKGSPFFSKLDIVEEPDELDGLAFMSLCHGAAIIASSTYSWWGAMMGAHVARNPVVYPAKWNPSSAQPDLFPAEWIPGN